jgi:cobalt-zinc-cadmium efflux system outer membrane protein
MLLALLIAAGLDVKALSFDEAMEAALRRPSVIAAREAVARRSQERAVPSAQPQLQVAPGFRANPADQRGLDAQLQFTQSFSLAQEPTKRAETGRLRRGLLEVEADAKVLSATLETAASWAEVWRAQKCYALTVSERDVAEEFVARIRLMAEAKVMTEADVAEAEAFSAEAELTRLAAEGALFESGLRLARQVEEHPSAPVLVSGELPSSSSEADATGGVTHPSVVAAQLAARVADARAQELTASSGPHVQAGVLLQRESPGSYITFMTATFTLPVWDVALHERNELVSEAALRRGEGLEAAREVRAGVASARHEVEHSREVLRAIRTKLVPATERLVQAREALLAAGEGELPSLTAARRQLLEIRRRLVGAEADEALARYRWSVVSRHLDGGKVE